MKNTEWIVSELAAVDFGDKRLNDRLIKTAVVLATKPSASLAEAAPSKASAKGAYRMFSNPRIDEDEILRCHEVESLGRAKVYESVYAIQDTTSLNFATHKGQEGFGVISYNGKTETTGLLLHTTLLVSAAGNPLGLLDQTCIVRPSRPKVSRQKQKNTTRTKAAKDKESRRWLEALEQTAASKVNREKIITLADRECDIYEFIASANALESKYIIRCCRDRATSEGKRLFALLADTATIGTHNIKVDGVAKKLAIKCVETEILAPADRNLKTRIESLDYEPQKVWVIEATEKSRAKERLHWILLTNIPTKTRSDVTSRLESYTKRWCIEQFHRILKSGCGIEKTPLESSEAIKRMIVLKSIIAVRLYQLTMAWREMPEASCTKELSTDEWKALHTRTFPGKALPKEAPTLRQVVFWLAQLGGYKRNPEKEPPGMIVIWRGWRELESCVAMWRSLRGQRASKAGICG